MKKAFVKPFIILLTISILFQFVTPPVAGKAEDKLPAEIINPLSFEETESRYRSDTFFDEGYPEGYRRWQLERADERFTIPEYPELDETGFHRTEPELESEFIPLTPEVIAETQAQVNAFDCATVTDVPKIECQALVALYESTNGAGWKDKTNWLQTTTAGNWFGVTVEDGRIINLNLWDNQLSGTIPDDLGNLSTIEVLWLGSNQLSGSIPAALGNLVNIQELQLSWGGLSGNIPAELGKLSNMVYLWLDNNQLSGSIPIELGNLSKLVYFRLDKNQLSGNIPPALGNLHNLWEFSLDDNQLSGNIPTALGNLPNLEYLGLAGNQLSGSIPKELGNLSNLEVLALGNNQLSGSIPTELGNLSNLTSLGLFYNQLTGSIPSAMGNLSNLTSLGLFYNQLTGSIPSALGNLSNLRGLDLTNNQLSGSIPPALGNFSNLTYLSLRDNQLSGNIPPELGNLSNSQYLDLSGNQLSGSIPTELGNLTKLWLLSMEGNKLTGSITTTLGKFINLKYLYLNNNELSGSIPAELGQLTKLRELHLNENAIDGALPNSFVNLVNLCEGIDEDNGCGNPESGLDLGYNRLNVPAQEPVAGFLEIKDPDWYLTQAVEETISGETGGTIQSNDGLTEIDIPAGAYTGEMTFHFIPHSSPGHPLRGLMEANNYFELISIVKGEEINGFALPLKVTINYTDQQIGSILEERLNLYQWKSDQSTWADAISVCPGGEYIRNLQENWLSLPLCELGEFALLGETQNIYLPLVTR